MSRKTALLILVTGLLASPLAPYAVAPAAAADAASVTSGASIYDTAGVKIGTVTDILTSSHGVAFAVVDVGAYVGKPKVVLCPLTRITGDGDHMTVSMTRTDVQQMPDFGYNIPKGAG